MTNTEIQSEARGFALYVGIDEKQALAAGVTLTELVRELRKTLNALVPGAETYAAVALAPQGSGGRNVDVVRTALHDPRALDQLVQRTDTEVTVDGVDHLPALDGVRLHHLPLVGVELAAVALAAAAVGPPLFRPVGGVGPQVVPADLLAVNRPDRFNGKPT